MKWIHKQIRKFISWYLYKVSIEQCVNTKLCTECPYHYKQGKYGLIGCTVSEVREIFRKSEVAGSE